MKELTLFDVASYEAPSEKSPATKKGKNRKTRSSKKPSLSQLQNCKQAIAHFRLGQTVQKRGYGKGLVVGFHLCQLPQIWVLWQKRNFPVLELPDKLLTIVAPSPRPNLPRDVKFDSGTEEATGREVLDNDSGTSPPPADVPESSPGVETYSPGGSARSNNRYFRLTWREGSRIRHKHIKGGSVTGNVASARAQQLRDAIARGRPLSEILQMC